MEGKLLMPSRRVTYAFVDVLYRAARRAAAHVSRLVRRLSARAFDYGSRVCGHSARDLTARSSLPTTAPAPGDERRIALLMPAYPYERSHGRPGRGRDVLTFGLG